MNQNWDLIGHEWAVDMLKKHVVHGTTRHAYLFAGPPGIGRRTLALRFAQALNCRAPIEPGVPCGRCRDCKQIEAKRHADLNLIEPLIKAPDNADVFILGPKGEKFVPSPNGEIRIFQIRDIQKTVNLKPFQSQHRVLIFLYFQQANAEASNALLKTLEEAPSYAVLILTADNPDLLLPTIVSRCEVLKLRPLSVEQVRQALEEKGFESQQSKWVAHISGGRFGYARRLIGSDSLLLEREERLDDLQRLVAASRIEKFAYADKLAKDKDAMRQTLLIWLSYWRDVMLRAAQAETPLVNVDRNMEIESIANQMDLASARRMVRGLEKALDQMDGNINTRLLAEVLLLDLPKL